MGNRGGPGRERRRTWSRRQFLNRAALAAAGLAVAGGARLRALASDGPALTAARRHTLDAALARLVPADGPDDWSAADVGAGDYVERLLQGHDIHAGGYEILAESPWIQRRFHQFLDLTRIKRRGWDDEVTRLRSLYARGIDDLDVRAGGDFATAPTAVQDAVLRQLDLSGDAFFSVLYDHAMEGTYSHPVYGGNRDRRAWDTFAYAGDTHGVRFAGIGPADAAWNRYGGYAPEEMAEPGSGDRWGAFG